MKSIGDKDLGVDRRLNFAAVILAAGPAERGSRPAQLSSWRGRTLVEHAVRNALAAGANDVIVVAGEHADAIGRQLKHLPARIVANRDHAEGLASSIRAGVAQIRRDAEAVVVCLCDQPRVTSAHIRDLARRVIASGGPSIAASSYDGIVGAPAAFHRSEFQRLMALRGPYGARQLLRDPSSAVAVIEFADANRSVPLEPTLSSPRLAAPGRSYRVPARSFEPRAPPIGLQPSA